MPTLVLSFLARESMLYQAKSLCAHLPHHLQSRVLGFKTQTQTPAVVAVSSAG